MKEYWEEGFESNSLGPRISYVPIPWEEIKNEEKKRFSGIAQLICEAAKSGDLTTAKDYWRKARFENPEVANTVFYENFSQKISDSYIEYANVTMNDIMFDSNSEFSQIEIAINNAKHFDEFHPMLPISEARLLVRKANFLGQYNHEECLELAYSKLSEFHDIDTATMESYSITKETFKRRYEMGKEEYLTTKANCKSYLENQATAQQNEAEWTFLIYLFSFIFAILYVLA